MGIVKLPSGKTARVPDGLNKDEVVELLFNNLPDGADKDAFGDMLDTSGWGSTIGSVIGGLGGGALGTFLGPAGTVGGGIAGGAGGAAVGEAIEQWWSGGKGTLGDVGKASAVGALAGVPLGGVVAGGKIATQLGLQGIKKAGTAAAGGAGLGAVSGAATAPLIGQDVKTGAAIGAGLGALGAGGAGVKQGLQRGAVASTAGDLTTNVLKGAKDRVSDFASRILRLNRPYKGLSNEIVGGMVQVGEGFAKQAAGRPTGAFQIAEGVRQIKLAVPRAMLERFKRLTGRTPNVEEHKAILEVASDVVTDIVKRDKADYAELLAAQAKAGIDEGVEGVVDNTGGIGGKYVDRKAEGGPITEAEGWAAESAKYAKDTIGNITPRQILEFVPVVGDILGAEEVYREIKKPNPNWYLIGALTAGTIVGLVPGVGDAAGAAIKAGARSVGRGVKAVDNALTAGRKVDGGDFVDVNQSLAHQPSRTFPQPEPQYGLNDRQLSPLGDQTNYPIRDTGTTTPQSRREIAGARADARAQSLHDKLTNTTKPFDTPVNRGPGRLLVDRDQPMLGSGRELRTTFTDDTLRALRGEDVSRSSSKAPSEGILVRQEDIKSDLYNYETAGGYDIHVPKTWKGSTPDFLSLPAKERIIVRWKAEGSPKWSLDKAVSDADSNIQARIFTDMVGSRPPGDALGSIHRGKFPEHEIYINKLDVPGGNATYDTRRHETGHAIDYSIGDPANATGKLPDNVMSELETVVGTSRPAQKNLDAFDEETAQLVSLQPTRQARRAFAKERAVKRKKLLKIGPKTSGKIALADYTPDQYAEEMVADAFNLIAKDPKRLKEIAPHTSAWIKEYVNSEEYVRNIINAQTAEGVPLKTVVGSLVALGATATVINQAIGGDAVKGGKGIVA